MEEIWFGFLGEECRRMLLLEFKGSEEEGFMLRDARQRRLSTVEGPDDYESMRSVF